MGSMIVHLYPYFVFSLLLSFFYDKNFTLLSLFSAYLARITYYSYFIVLNIAYCESVHVWKFFFPALAVRIRVKLSFQFFLF
jgi:hypothetical protein